MIKIVSDSRVFLLQEMEKDDRDVPFPISVSPV